jgi:hypothetical protein
MVGRDHETVAKSGTRTHARHIAERTPQETVSGGAVSVTSDIQTAATGHHRPPIQVVLEYHWKEVS